MTTNEKHSRLGIASFVIGLVAWVLMPLQQIFIDYIMVRDVEADANLASWLPILSAVGVVVAIVLGVGGLFQREKKKTFAILGILVSLTFVAVVLIMLSNNMLVEPI